MNWEAVLSAAEHLADPLAVRAILGLLVVAIVWRLALWSRSSFVEIATRRGVDASARLLGTRLLHGLFAVVAVVWVLDILGVALSVVLTTLGVAGLAFGLAVQDILKSFFAGIYLLFERPFLIGDEIQVKEHVGRVENVGFRSTSLRTAENVLVVIPNSMLFVEAVSNRSQRRTPGSDDVTGAE